jgi:C1A family cysteine protease
MKTTLFTPVVLILMSFSTSYAESLVNVQNLNHDIQKQQLGWVAKDTWLTHLSKAQARRMMGLKNTPSADVEFVAPQSSQATADLPSSLDWRNKDGKNWVSPILNQGNCGSCVAFASIGVLETQVNISSIFPNLNVRFSPQNLFACGGGACESGWYPSAAASTLMRKGVTDEACMPYTSGATGEDVSCHAACANSAQRTYKISSYRAPTASIKNVASVKRALQKGPVVTTLSVYADFMAYSSGVYKHASGEVLGGHAISIIGYDDASQSYIIRNSWGQDWGEKGFGHVAYSDVSGVGNTTISFEVPAVTGAVSLLTPRDYSYVTGDYEFEANSSFSATDGVSITVYDKNNQSVWSGTCPAAECKSTFDSTKLADGRYEVQATAFDAHGGKLATSTTQFFYVVNHEPSLSLAFTGKGVDLSQPLSERIEFAITAHSSGVPMSSIEFHFKDSSGKETVRTAEVVLEQMTMGWRTNLIADGNYEIWMVGHVKSNGMDVKAETEHQTVTLKN